METITYVIAPAANMVEIPLFAFPTPEQAHEFCRSLGLRGARRIGEGEYGEGEYEPILDSPVTSYHYAWQGGEYVSLAWALQQEEQRPEGEETPLMSALFADGHYYSGCGEVYRLDIRTHEIGAPVVPWDLD